MTSQPNLQGETQQTGQPTLIWTQYWSLDISHLEKHLQQQLDDVAASIPADLQLNGNSMLLSKQHSFITTSNWPRVLCTRSLRDLAYLSLSLDATSIRQHLQIINHNYQTQYARVALSAALDATWLVTLCNAPRHETDRHVAGGGKAWGSERRRSAWGRGAREREREKGDATEKAVSGQYMWARQGCAYGGAGQPDG